MTNILFYKLLAYERIFKEVQYIENKHDTEYCLDTFKLCNKYNPIEKLKELEDDIESQILNENIISFIEQHKQEKEITTITKELINLLNEEFKYFEQYLIDCIFLYIIRKAF